MLSFMPVFLTYLWSRHKRNMKFTKYLAHRAMIMSYISDGTGATADEHRFVHFIHTPDCSAREMKVKSTHPRSDEETKPFEKKIKGCKKGGTGGGENVENNSLHLFHTLVALLASNMNIFQSRHIINHSKQQAGIFTFVPCILLLSKLFITN